MAHAVVHSVPIKTDFEGSTDIAENFTSTITVDAESGLQRTTLRGRSLLGRTIELPPSHVISLVTTTVDPATRCVSQQGEEELVLPHQFQLETTAAQYTQWEHDRIPTGCDTLQQWIALAAVIHAP